MLEQVGEPVPPDKEETEKKEREVKRANLEGFFQAHKENN